MLPYQKEVMENNRGVALLLAVTVISLLVALTVQFNRDMRRELVNSANTLSSSSMNAIIKSGYNLGEAVLLHDAEENEFDSYHDGWAEIGGDSLAQFYPGGRLEVVIKDLSGKIQLNSLVNSAGKATGKVAKKTKESLGRLFLSGDLGEFSDEETNLLIDAIIDWIDKDDDENGIEETESSYYSSRNPSYACKNGPVEFEEELLLVRGITSELFYGNEEFAGLKDLVTAQGSDGKININTAPASVLKTLGEDMNDELAEKMVSYRQEKENKEDLQEKSWYLNIPQWPGDVELEADLITTSSTNFQLIARAEKNSMEKTMTAVVNRQPGGKLTTVHRKVE